MHPSSQPDSKHPYLIYGAGAVGLGLGSFLISAGCSVVFVGRPETVKHLQTHGLQREGIFGAARHPPHSFTAVPSLARIRRETGFPTVLVTVKSYDTPTAARDIAGFLADRPPPYPLVVLCQNGWGHHETFRQCCPGLEPALARLITGFERRRPHAVRVSVHADAMRLGFIDQTSHPDLPRLADDLNKGGFQAALSDDIVVDLWTKMLYNCALNPLSALLQTTYGRLADHSETAAVMKEVIVEGFDVMRAAGWRCRYENAEAYWRAFIGTMVPKTARHFSSMAQDLASGRRTEIDALNGCLVRMAQRLGRTVPVNATLVRLLRFAEADARTTQPEER